MHSDVKILAGKVTEHGPFSSAINKQVITEPVWVSETGLSNDQQADKRFHGGPERALHYYPQEHYQAWLKQYPAHPKMRISGFGENISGLGFTEQNLAIGDIFQLGGAQLQISQPRSPCFKLNHRFEIANLALQMQMTGRCGWFFRVLQPGWVKPNDSLTLIQRSDYQLMLWQVLQSAYLEPFDKKTLKCWINDPYLADNWRKKACQRLQTGKIENWNDRLFGQSAFG
ncbi:MOSC domain-containing protein [Motilimonas pumila]|uniref:MOSC domain-containing protein n=1 Tax=Motilimonas pumila TaxID=2303987 RepID=A0A418YA71_9GAMM|nr:MOSC domain-containing protein [Motilimonas pumila]RJG39181.1 MOSC domain-containing protein [Motilimonas pumila]